MFKTQRQNSCRDTSVENKYVKKTSIISVLSLMLSVCGFFNPFLLPVAVLLGIIALFNITICRNKLKGSSYAIIAIVLSLSWLLLFLIRFGFE